MSYLLEGTPHILVCIKQIRLLNIISIPSFVTKNTIHASSIPGDWRCAETDKYVLTTENRIDEN